ncbi:uncharacterized protein LOC121836077 isoform X2 [Ixodes scapularis]|uniref:uncharacterized protein LOC121836077 isoform X2 n=1 Tax=Ixodes scapularis TaxID=6945 RepID=UPI001C39084A|nr:uncharacterized protein LOC121836077 isoform X2 [Ixodes scapularis]
MHAYVKFTDGVHLILPTSLVKKFTPRDAADFDATRLYEAYWVSDSGEGEDEDFYNANVILLGESLDDLLKKMQLKRYPIPRILDGSATQKQPARKHVQDLGRKEKKNRKEIGKRSRLDDIAADFKKKQKTQETRAAPQEDRILRHLLQEKEGKIKRLQKELAEEQAHSRRLGLALAMKIAASEPQWRRPGTSSEEHLLAEPPSFEGIELLEDSPSRLVEEVPKSPVPSTSYTGNLSGAEKSTDEPSLGRAPFPSADQQPGNLSGAEKSTDQPSLGRAPLPSADQQPGFLLPEPALPCAGPAPPVLIEGDGMVHLGSGLKVAKLKLDDLVSKLPEQRFIKDLSRTIYSTAELCARSVTGEPSRRFLKEGAKGKLPVTPAKMMALASGLMYYERAKKPEAERRPILELQTVVRDILKDFLPDVARQGRRRVAPKE